MERGTLSRAHLPARSAAARGDGAGEEARDDGGAGRRGRPGGRPRRAAGREIQGRRSDRHSVACHDRRPGAQGRHRRAEVARGQRGAEGAGGRSRGSDRRRRLGSRQVGGELIGPERFGAFRRRILGLNFRRFHALCSRNGPVAETKTHITPGQRTAPKLQLEGVWRVVVLNDPVNLMSYVVHVFKRVFGFDESTARKHMLEVHEQGRSVVWSGLREKAEAYTFTLQQWHLSAVLEPDEA